MGELPGFFFDRERGKYFHITKKTPTEVIQQLAAKEDADLRMQTQQQLNRTRPQSVLPFLLSRGILAGNNQIVSEAAVERTLLWSIPSRARVYMPLQSTGYRNRMAVDPSGMVAICNGPRLTVNAQPMLALSPHVCYCILTFSFFIYLIFDPPAYLNCPCSFLSVLLLLHTVLRLLLLLSYQVQKQLTKKQGGFSA
jgi:hypothetical protein